MDKKYDVDALTLGGRVAVNVRGAQKGDAVIVVVEGTYRAFEDSATAHAGDILVGKVRTGEALILTGEEFEDFRERLIAQRRENENHSKGTSQLPGVAIDEYLRKPIAELRKLCKDRALSGGGGKQDLAQRLVDAGG